MTPIIELHELRRRFGSGDRAVTALAGIDLTVAADEFLAVRGASGSGKSTLLQVLGHIDTFDSGTYLYGGRSVAELRARELSRIRNAEIGFVFQFFHLLADRSALENVALPLLYRRGGEAPRDPRAVLERVGLAGRLRHRPSELSGGECQRVAIARALVKRPRLLLLDEPTGNLDSKTGVAILDLLEEIHREDRVAIVLVTHEESVATRADRVLTMQDGRWL